MLYEVAWAVDQWRGLHGVEEGAFLECDVEMWGGVWSMACVEGGGCG